MQNKEEGNDQESIQSSTTPDPRNHMGKCLNTRKRHTQESHEVTPFPAGEHNAARNRQDSIIKRIMIYNLQKRSTKEAPPRNGQ